MKILFFTLLSAVPCFGAQDIFAFKDVGGFEKCMRVDSLIDVAKTNTGSQGRMLNGNEIRERCLESAVVVLKSEKKKAVVEEYVMATKRNAAHEASMVLIERLIQVNPKSCNDMIAYEVILKVLSHPMDGGTTDPVVGATRRVIQTCLKDGEFKKDFLEEKDNANSYISNNACEILKAENVLKTCKKD